MKPLVEVFVGLAAARDVNSAVANLEAVPCKARRARSHRCEVHTSACRCKNVQWSCLCSAMKMCVGVCTVCAHARVLARARVSCVCTAQPLPNEPTRAGNGLPAPEAELHRPDSRHYHSLPGQVSRMDRVSMINSSHLLKPKNCLPKAKHQNHRTCAARARGHPPWRASCMHFFHTVNRTKSCSPWD